MRREDTPVTRLPVGVRWLGAAWAAHALAAAGWWWLMRSGFPWSHPRFWSNTVAPWAVILLSLAVRVSAEGGTIDLECGGLRIELRPLLTFHSRSPDRFWTIFAPRQEARGPSPEADGVAGTSG